MTTVTQWFSEHVLPVRPGFYQRDWEDSNAGEWRESLTIVPDYFDGAKWHCGKADKNGVLTTAGEAFNNRGWRGLVVKP